MTNEEEQLARQYVANPEDVSTSTSLLRKALAEIDRLRAEAALRAHNNLTFLLGMP